MDAKLNQSDLISLLAKECNISVAKAEVFTKNFFDIIIEGLEQDGIVKINGLGTFKVTDVASRGSVNVNTGEKIEIKGHRKLTFIPADTLKEQVNMPFAMFEPVEVDDTYQPDSAEENDAEEIAETTEPVVEVAEAEEVQPAVAEENESADTVNEELPVIVEDTPAEEETASEDSNDDTVANKEQVEVAVEEDSVVPQPEEDKVEDAREQESEEPVVVQERPTEPVIVRVPPKKSAQEKQPAPSKRKKSGWRYSLIAIMAIAVAFILINRTADKSVVVEDAKEIAKPVAVEPEIEPVAENTDADAAIMQPELPTVAENVEPVIAEEVSNEAEKVKAPAQTVIEQQPADEYEFVMVDELAAKNLKYITSADTLLYVADGDLAVHKVAQDETLTRIAREYYGDKKLWPYIVKYNNMTDPNGLCRGMEIAIPRLKPRK
jgi:nucleoid DNA-binding protein